MLTFCQSQQLNAPLPATQFDRKSKVSWQRGAGAFGGLVILPPCWPESSGKGVLLSSLLFDLVLQCASNDLRGPEAADLWGKEPDRQAFYMFFQGIHAPNPEF